MQLPIRELSALLLSAIFLLFGILDIAQADNTLEADGPSQNLKSVAQIYSTSTAQPAVLAIHGGTILSGGDRVSVLPPGGVAALEAQGIGSRITSENSNILASSF